MARACLFTKIMTMGEGGVVKSMEGGDRLRRCAMNIRVMSKVLP